MPNLESEPLLALREKGRSDEHMRAFERQGEFIIIIIHRYRKR